MTLSSAYCNAVEGHVVVHCLGVEDQPVIGDYLDTRIPGCLSSSSGGGAVMGGEDDNLDALGDQVFDVGSFLGRVALTEEDLDFVAGGFEGFPETSLILNPARFLFGRQNNAN